MQDINMSNVIKEVIHKAKEFHYQEPQIKANILHNKHKGPVMEKWQLLADDISGTLEKQVNTSCPLSYPCQWINISIDRAKIDNENAYYKNVHLFRSFVEPFATCISTFDFTDGGIKHRSMIVLDEVGVYGPYMKKVKEIALNHYDLIFLDPRELLTTYDPIPDVPITYRTDWGPPNLYEYLFTEQQLYPNCVLRG